MIQQLNITSKHLLKTKISCYSCLWSSNVNYLIYKKYVVPKQLLEIYPMVISASLLEYYLKKPFEPPKFHF